jgi:hypothetical protein
MKFTLSRLLLITFLVAIVLGIVIAFGANDMAVVKEIFVKGNLDYVPTTTSEFATLILCCIASVVAFSVVSVLVVTVVSKLWCATAIPNDDPSFNVLCLGVKFRYTNPGVDRTWVKIGHNEIAEWNASQLTTNWVGQQLCCFADDDSEASLSQKVILVEQ